MSQDNALFDRAANNKLGDGLAHDFRHPIKFNDYLMSEEAEKFPVLGSFMRARHMKRTGMAGPVKLRGLEVLSYKAYRQALDKLPADKVDRVLNLVTIGVVQKKEFAALLA